MPQVAVQINGKTYRMACDEGQEAHLLDLAQRFNKTIDSLRGSFGEIGDQRLTVMAGIMVQDELVGAQRKMMGLEAELASIRTDGGTEDAVEREAVIAELSARVAALSNKVKDLL